MYREESSIRCSRCRLPIVRGHIREVAFRLEPPVTGEYFIWNEGQAQAGDRYSEPVREDLDGCIILNVNDFAEKVMIAGDRRYCPNHHEVTGGRYQSAFVLRRGAVIVSESLSASR